MDTPAYIIAIGSSSGGLTPMLNFFSHTLPDNAAYVIARHFPDDVRSHLREILQKRSLLEVIEAGDNMPVEKNKVYVLPPGYYMTIAHDRLHLQKRSGSANCAVDILFNSVAREYKNKAIGVILSGGGHNGMKGVKSISTAGGMVLAQLPSTCEFKFMPEYAIETGCVDHVLPPEQMPAAIRDYTSNHYANRHIAG